MFVLSSLVIIGGFKVFDRFVVVFIRTCFFEGRILVVCYLSYF